MSPFRNDGLPSSPRITRHLLSTRVLLTPLAKERLFSFCGSLERYRNLACPSWSWKAVGWCENFSSQSVSHLPHLLGRENGVFQRCKHSRSLRITGDPQMLSSSACTPFPDEPLCFLPCPWHRMVHPLLGLMTCPLPTLSPLWAPGPCVLSPLPRRDPAGLQPLIPGQTLVLPGDSESRPSRNFLFCTRDSVFVSSVHLTWLLSKDA